MAVTLICVFLTISLIFCDVIIAQSEGSCGKPYFEPKISLKKPAGKTRIVDGTEALPFSYPWMVSLQLFDAQKQKWSHLCGGSLIRVYPNVEFSDILITAVHCLDGGRIPLQAVIGAHSLSKPTAEQVTVKVDKQEPYPLYDQSTVFHDIAVLKLKSPVKFGQTIHPICLPETNKQLPTDAPGIVTGWGLLEESKSIDPNHPQKYPDVLMQVILPVIDSKKCANYYANRDFDSKIQFCAGFENGGQDSCSEDSGGPYILKSNSTGGTKRYVLEGVVSNGEGCARVRKPGVYVKVSSYVDWINKTAKKLTSLKPKKSSA